MEIEKFLKPTKLYSIVNQIHGQTIGYNLAGFENFLIFICAIPHEIVQRTK